MCCLLGFLLDAPVKEATTADMSIKAHTKFKTPDTNAVRQSSHAPQKYLDTFGTRTLDGHSSFSAVPSVAKTQLKSKTYTRHECRPRFLKGGPVRSAGARLKVPKRDYTFTRMTSEARNRQRQGPISSTNHGAAAIFPARALPIPPAPFCLICVHREITSVCTEVMRAGGGGGNWHNKSSVSKRRLSESSRRRALETAHTHILATGR